VLLFYWRTLYVRIYIYIYIILWYYTYSYFSTTKFIRPYIAWTCNFRVFYESVTFYLFHTLSRVLWYRYSRRYHSRPEDNYFSISIITILRIVYLCTSSSLVKKHGKCNLFFKVECTYSSFGSLTFHIDIFIFIITLIRLCLWPRPH